MVSPFNSDTGFNFRGVCELTALMSCNVTEPGFAVRVDFLTDTEANGAVGVFIGDLRWIGHENGSFFSDVEAAPSTDPSILEYPGNNIRVLLNAAENTNEIEVGGNVQVTIVHKYRGI